MSRHDFGRSPNDILNGYNLQIRKFRLLGVGAYTEFGVKVTDKLKDRTIKRRDELLLRRIDL